eukprot:gene13416-9231_t
MINWWLILLIILIPIIAILVSVYVLFYFQSEEDGVGEYVPKTVFCVSMVLAVGMVLLVPFDAANSPDPAVINAYSETLNTQLMWKIMMWLMAAFALVICPFTTFYYESYDPEKPNRTKQVVRAFTITGVIFLVFLVVSLICYTQVGVATIPFHAYIHNPENVIPDAVSYTSVYTVETFEVEVDYEVYVFGLLCVIGWIAFLVYGGVGIAAYPINTFRDFLNRPKRLSSSQFAEEMGVILDKSEALMEMCVEMKNKARGPISRADATRINILRNEVMELEDYQARLIYTFTTAGGSPFFIYGRLVLAIISICLALLWIVQIFVYNTFDLSPCVNVVLIELGTLFPLLGVLAYGVMAFYLMWATFNGQIALGLRLVFFQIYPMKKHDTLLNALLFNSFLMLLTSFAVVQFVSRSFRDYAPLSSINGLMNVYIIRLKGVGFIIAWAQFLVVGVSLLSVLWLIMCPKKGRKENREDPRLLDLDIVR